MEIEGAVAVVVCAAGDSSRMGGVKKEYQKINEELTVLGAAISAFAAVASVEHIVIAIPKGGEAAAREALPPRVLELQKPKVLFVEGGKTRQASVYNALKILGSFIPRYVLIHDGARPWVSVPLIENIINAVVKYHAVIPLVPVAETPKECDMPIWERKEIQDQEIFIKNHLKRASTGVAQTPQGFKFPEILYAHEKASTLGQIDFTDDAEIWGMFCGPVAVIPGSPENRKITYIEDIEI
jgi:2-C-methyl-D-erythritol 4-phosphate cytidylyltransferase